MTVFGYIADDKKPSRWMVFLRRLTALMNLRGFVGFLAWFEGIAIAIESKTGELGRTAEILIISSRCVCGHIGRKTHFFTLFPQGAAPSMLVP